MCCCGLTRLVVTSYSLEFYPLTSICNWAARMLGVFGQSAKELKYRSGILFFKTLFTYYPNYIYICKKIFLLLVFSHCLLLSSGFSFSTMRLELERLNLVGSKLWGWGLSTGKAQRSSINSVCTRPWPIYRQTNTISQSQPICWYWRH